MKRVSRTVSKKEDIDFLINLDEDTCCSSSFMMENFGSFNDRPPRFHPYDFINIPPDSYGPPNKRNKNTFTTTVGIWIFNKAFLEKDFFDLIGYFNESINKKSFGKLNTKMSYALLEDKITLDQLKLYVEKTQKFQPYCNILAPSVTTNCMQVPKFIRKKKQELFFITDMIMFWAAMKQAEAPEQAHCIRLVFVLKIIKIYLKFCKG